MHRACSLAGDLNLQNRMSPSVSEVARSGPLHVLLRKGVWGCQHTLRVHWRALWAVPLVTSRSPQLSRRALRAVPLTISRSPQLSRDSRWQPSRTPSSSEAPPLSVPGGARDGTPSAGEAPAMWVSGEASDRSWRRPVH